MGSAFAKAINDLDEVTFQALYGRWDPPEPAQVAALFAGSGVRWWIAGGRALRPLLPGDPLTPGCEQLWTRRDAQHPWQLDLLLDRSDAEWVFKRDSQVHLPWPQALHEVHGVPHLRPEVALLHKTARAGG